MTAGPWTLTLTGPRFSSNDRLHFRVRDQLVIAWRDLGQVHARALVGASFQPLERAHVVVTQVPGSRRRTDVGNCAPAAKAAIDGIVRAGLLRDDDSKHLVGVEYRLATDPVHPDAHTAGPDAVHRRVAAATAAGWIVRTGTDPAAVPITLHDGRTVWLDDYGAYTDQPPAAQEAAA